MAKSALRVAILGAGPIGIEAAVWAKHLGWKVTLYERARLAEHLRRWGHVKLFTPFGSNSTPLSRQILLKENPKHTFPADHDYLTGRDHLTHYLEPLSKWLGPDLQTEMHVLHVGRKGLLKDEVTSAQARAKQPFVILVRDKQNKERLDEADILFDCTGTYAQHRWVGESGIPALGERAAEQHISYWLDDILGEHRNHYANKTVLVVGSGYSAATSVCLLSELAKTAPDTWVIWLSRGSSSAPLKRQINDTFKERDRLAAQANLLATRSEGNVEFHPGSVVTGIEHLGQDKGFRVITKGPSKARTYDVERLIANVGYSPDTLVCRELQIDLSPFSLAPRTWAVQTIESETDANAANISISALQHPEPGAYVLGAKSFGRHSGFLMQQGFEQLRLVFSHLLGKPMPVA